MALSLKRFIAILVVGMTLAIAGAIGLAEFTEMAFNWDISPRSQQAKSRLGALDDAIAALERRDSIIASLRAKPPAPGLTIVLPPGGTPAERDSVTEIIRSNWNERAGDAKAYPVVVLVRTNRSQSELVKCCTIDRLDFALVPDPPRLNACVVDIWAPRDLVKGRVAPFVGLSWIRAVSTRMAPCVTIARYGAPGPAVARWLNSESWHPVTVAPAVARLNGPSEGPVDPERQPRSTGAFVGGLFPSSDAWSRDLSRAGFSLSGSAPALACLSNKLGECAKLLRSADATNRSLRGASLLPQGVLRRAAYNVPAWRRSLVFDIERSLGPEKFAQFWKTTEEPEVALEKLYSGGGAQLIHDRLAERVLPLSSNPWPTLPEWGLHLALIGLLAAAVYASAKNRAMRM